MVHEKCIQNFDQRSSREESLGRSRHRWEDVRMDLREVGWEGIDWMHLAQNRDQWQALVNTAMNLVFH
jgi:hypothetical protein